MKSVAGNRPALNGGESDRVRCLYCPTVIYLPAGLVVGTNGMVCSRHRSDANEIAEFSESLRVRRSA
jgi:hypothetical protein